MTKYTGARRGKSGSNDASAETMAKVIQIMDEAGVYWQIGELGAVDVGGGGTVALFVAGMDVDVVDMGVPIYPCMPHLSWHRNWISITHIWHLQHFAAVTARKFRQERQNVFLANFIK